MNRVVRGSIIVGLVAAAQAQTVRAQTETHTNLQVVTTNGASAWGGSHPFTIKGEDEFYAEATRMEGTSS